MERLLFFCEGPFLGFLLLCAAVSFLGCYPVRPAGARPLLKYPYLLFAAVFLLAAAWVGRFPVRHVVVFDEYNHMGIAETLLAAGKLCELKKGGTAAPEICGVPAWPGGYHSALAVWFGLRPGDREAAAAKFSFFVIALTCLALFLLLAESGAPAWSGVLAVLLLCSSPPYLAFFSSTETGLFSAFLVTLSLLALQIHLRRESRWSALLLVSAACAALLTRYENLLLLIILPLGLWLNKRSFKAFARYSPLLAVSLTLFFLHIHFARHHISVLNLVMVPEFPRTFAMNLLYWLDPDYSDVFTSLLALAGAVSAFRAGSVLPAAVAAYLPVYSLAVPHFSSSPEMLRFALTLVPLVCALAVRGLETALGRIRRAVPAGGRLLAAALVLVPLYAAARAVPAGKAWRSVPEQTERKGREFLRAASGQVSPDAYFLTYAPAYVALGTGRKAALPEFYGGIRAELAVLKDGFWYATARQYPELEAELNRNFRFDRVAVMRPELPEGADNYSLHILSPAIGERSAGSSAVRALSRRQGR